MTHCDRLLEELSDGEWHPHTSLYRLGMIVHSRVADLRRKGYVIETERDGDLHLYRLVGRLDEADAAPGVDGEGHTGTDDIPPSPSAPLLGVSLVEPVQLELVA